MSDSDEDLEEPDWPKFRAYFVGGFMGGQQRTVEAHAVKFQRCITDFTEPLSPLSDRQPEIEEIIYTMYAQTDDGVCVYAPRDWDSRKIVEWLVDKETKR